MRIITHVLLLAAALPLAAVAQAQPAPAARPASDPSIAALRTNWQQVIENVTAAAEELTEAEYAYRPVATVRTFGELIGHIAGSQDLMCAAALGEPQPAEDAVESSARTKAALVAALKASTDHCAKAYAITAAQAAIATEMFGSPTTRAGALALNAVHDGEHYGNIITYMRMMGKVPPSSRR
ncbi:MAG: DinB family protein [Gemmatimonadota bacterium]|nr:DinB family protein [Gemmatimonadota bacterium]